MFCLIEHDFSRKYKEESYGEEEVYYEEDDTKEETNKAHYEDENIKELRINISNETYF